LIQTDGKRLDGMDNILDDYIIEFEIRQVDFVAVLLLCLKGWNATQW